MKNSFLVIILFLVSVQANSQKLPKSAIGEPEIYGMPTQESSNAEIKATSEKYWTVYSDRENNNTFTSPGGSEKLASLGFMEMFYVAEVKGDYIHIFKTDNIDKGWPSIHKSAKSFGWIHKDRLLLWQHCLRDSKARVNRKAMILHTFEGLGEEKIGEQAVYFRKDPALFQKTGQQSKLFEILFVYKIIDNAVLLGENFMLSGRGYDLQSSIRGWVPINKVTFWDTRITIEPNWDPDAYQERFDKEITPSVFLDEKAALDFKIQGSCEAKYTIWSREPGPKRMIGQWRRFPIIEERNYGVIRSGVMGKLNESLSSSMTSIDFATLEAEVQRLEQKVRKINIVFVVDGTESIAPYYSTINKGIHASVMKLIAEQSINRIRFGAVVYRDLAEGEHIIDLISLTENHNSIMDFFDTIRTDYSKDEDYPEALFYGIKQGITKVGLNKGESNFIILIGDAGNHSREDESQVEESELVDLLAEYECSLISYQVNNGNNPAYNDFINQSRKLILATAQKERTTREEIKKFWQEIGIVPLEPFFLSEGPNHYTLNPQETMGSYLFPGKNSQLPFDYLEREIENKIEQIDDTTSYLIAELRKVSRAEEADMFNPAVINLLSKIKGLSRYEINQLKDFNYQFSMKGYTAIEIDKLNNPLFRYVVFLARDELGEVVTDLRKLCEYGGTVHQRRIRMQNIWIDVLVSILGPQSRDDILELSIDELNQVVFGLPCQSELMKTLNLRDITDPSVLSDVDFERYVDDLTLKLKNLRPIYNGNYLEGFISNNKSYYWIPIEYLP